MVRSNAAGETGFLERPLDGPRRLNVVMIRTQRFCVIVGDWYTLRSSQTAPTKTLTCTTISTHSSRIPEDCAKSNRISCLFPSDRTVRFLWCHRGGHHDRTSDVIGVRHKRSD
ncbi:C-terminal helicase domain-containing protein [Natrinema sp. CBA1119]|uniref:C-terminal helicase domain-containing protein n=1 Tax=Natrinema sp. CBA1119 TaxID=1608465 RepID=UPI0020D28660|nr:C-terminal helicase domain-containing protein [Natrinema sp. CBA1119]